MVLVLNTAALFLTVVVGGLYLWGIEHTLFWIYWWYDIPLHLLGGAVVGLWGSAVALRLRLSSRHAFLLVGALIAVVGVGWEVLELWLGLTDPNDALFMADTLQDLVCDAVGALAVCSLYPFLRRT